MLNRAQAVYRVDQTWFPHLLTPAFTTLLTIVLIALLISLGRWQLRRADEKRVLFDSFAAGTDATRLIDLGTPHLRRYQHVEAARTLRSDTADPHRQHDQWRARRLFRDHAVRADGRRLGAGESRLGSSGCRAAPSVRPSRSAATRGGSAAAPTICRAPAFRWATKAPLAPPYPVVANFPSHAEIARLLQRILVDSGGGSGAARRRRTRRLCAQLVGTRISADAPHRLRGAMVRTGADLGASSTSSPIFAGDDRGPSDAVPTCRHDQPSAQDRRQRRLLIGLALLFFAPLALAFYLYYGHGTWRPGGRVNAAT